MPARQLSRAETNSCYQWRHHCRSLASLLLRSERAVERMDDRVSKRHSFLLVASCVRAALRQGSNDWRDSVWYAHQQMRQYSFCQTSTAASDARRRTTAGASNTQLPPLAFANSMRTHTMGSKMRVMCMVVAQYNALARAQNAKAFPLGP